MIDRTLEPLPLPEEYPETVLCIFHILNAMRPTICSLIFFHELVSSKIHTRADYIEHERRNIEIL